MEPNLYTCILQPSELIHYRGTPWGSLLLHIKASKRFASSSLLKKYGYRYGLSCVCFHMRPCVFACTQHTQSTHMHVLSWLLKTDKPIRNEFVYQGYSMSKFLPYCKKSGVQTNEAKIKNKVLIMITIKYSCKIEWTSPTYIAVFVQSLHNVKELETLLFRFNPKFIHLLKQDPPQLKGYQQNSLGASHSRHTAHQ